MENFDITKIKNHQDCEKYLDEINKTRFRPKWLLTKSEVEKAFEEVEFDKNKKEKTPPQKLQIYKDGIHLGKIDAADVREFDHFVGSSYEAELCRAENDFYQYFLPAPTKRLNLIFCGLDDEEYEPAGCGKTLFTSLLPELLGYSKNEIYKFNSSGKGNSYVFERCVIGEEFRGEQIDQELSRSQFFDGTNICENGIYDKIFADKKYGVATLIHDLCLFNTQQRFRELFTSIQIQHYAKNEDGTIDRTKLTDPEAPSQLSRRNKVVICCGKKPDEKNQCYGTRGEIKSLKKYAKHQDDGSEYEDLGFVEFKTFEDDKKITEHATIFLKFLFNGFDKEKYKFDFTSNPLNTFDEGLLEPIPEEKITPEIVENYFQYTIEPDTQTGNKYTAQFFEMKAEYLKATKNSRQLDGEKIKKEFKK